MTKVLNLDEIVKICNIIQSNQNKINLLRNDITQNSNENFTKIRTQQFLNNLEIDLMNILSILERIKINLGGINQNQNMNYKTYCINSDRGNNQDIVICGCCQCCKCCECSTNNCSYDHQINLSNDRIDNKNEYIKERINSEDDKYNDNGNLNFNKFNINNSPTFSPQLPHSNSKNNYTFPSYNLDGSYNNNDGYNDYNTFNLNKDKNLNPKKEGNLIYSQSPSFSPQNNINNLQNDLQKPFGYIKRQPFNNNNNIMDSEDINLPIEEKIKNSAIIKSKRFHGSKSFDHIEIPSSRNNNKGRIITSKKKNNFDNNNDYNIDNNNLNRIFQNNSPDTNKIKNKDNIFNNIRSDKKNNLKNIFNNNDDDNNDDNIYNNLNNKNINDNDNLAQKKGKMEKMNRIQKFINKLYRQPKEVVDRLKKIFGIDMEEKLLSGEINNDKLNEMENILDKIVKMSIWGEEEKMKKKERKLSTSINKKDKKKKIIFNYNPIQEKIKLMKDLKNNQVYFREFPRGWYSTKEYFINNGTDINNENINKYV